MRFTQLNDQFQHFLTIYTILVRALERLGQVKQRGRLALKNSPLLVSWRY
uniref:Uncharacterized protein n=1 Tax=Utricularia reniformis TaxID=192314 RepID=A0A1Y0AZ98_9LAMI|nr:hypothetical protein AEK19_MT0227 [Utricularia reniformis]ART30506.1 hypothetical protein AEK19_MT0227 [Utricularia reniformis]